MAVTSCQSSGAWNLKAVTEFWENLWTPIYTEFHVASLENMFNFRRQI